MNKKIAFVVQRYGVEVLGGAESLARQLAERFADELNWDIQVLTTTAVDYTSWSNKLPPGSSTLNKVRILRFNSAFGRFTGFGILNRISKIIWPVLAKFDSLNWLARCWEWLWFVAQGPVCPDLVDYLKKNASSFDQVFFFTYLYYPALWGHKVCLPKGVLISTAHDEMPFHFFRVKELLRTIPKIVTLNPEETALVRRKLDVGHEKVVLVGLGIEVPEFKEDRKSTAKNVLYLGRISVGKGVPILFDVMGESFADVSLRLAGKIEGDISLPKLDQIDFRGFVSEEEKTGLIDDATVVVNPSPHESLSLIVLEAMARYRPVIVNGNCPVLDYYCKETKTVFAFKNKDELKTVLAAVLSTDWSSEENTKALIESSNWVRERYSWAAVEKTYQTLI